MKKLAANYVVTPTGTFLKNGILISEQNGFIVEFIDTKDDLREIALLSFLNGILFPNFTFVKEGTENNVLMPESSFYPVIQESLVGLERFSVEKLIEMGIQVQELFPELEIPEIITGITEELITTGNFRKQISLGIFILTGANLVEMHFTKRSKLKKIL